MDSRYDFGRNWSDLAARLDNHHLDEAKRNLARLAGDVRGRNFLDLGCGSGLHSAAALALGANSVVALDYDPVCVSTATAVLQKFAPNGNWKVSRADALDPKSLPEDMFDIVYSWGVLHHTGAMWAAIDNAARLVKPGGEFCLALYLKTPFCNAWKAEKKIYARNKWLRPLVKWPYVLAFLTWKQIATRDAASFVREYSKSRGMEFVIDVDDWLGGYPYETVSPTDLKTHLEQQGFALAEAFNTTAGRGIFGTGCGEWRFVRAAV